MDLRVRLMGRLLRRSSITRMTPESIAAAQARTLPRNAVTDALFGGVAPGVATEDRTIPTPDGPLPARVHTPDHAAGPTGAVLNLHGGGWVLGSLEQSDWLCSTVAARAGTVVVSVDYRLAPTHRFPAAVDDAWAALLWAATHAGELGADPDRLAVMGDSAGGNLAAVLCLLARDHGGPPIRHQALIYPATDLTLGEAVLRALPDAPVLTPADMVAFRDHYLGDPAAEAGDPRASPLLAPDHRGLPPALIQVAEHDPLRDDGVRYAAALRAAGVPVRFTEYVGMPHGFASFPRLCRGAPQAAAEIADELRDVL